MRKVRPPCYNAESNTDCKDRQLCLARGRDKCEKWNEYEKLHKQELEAERKCRDTKEDYCTFLAGSYKRAMNSRDGMRKKYAKKE